MAGVVATGAYFIVSTNYHLVGGTVTYEDNGTDRIYYRYDSFGKLIYINGTLKDSVGVKNPYRYRGYRYDTENGLYYLQSRYYNSDWVYEKQITHLM